MRAVAWLFLAFVNFAYAADGAENLILLTENAPPYNMLDAKQGVIVGIVTDLVKKALNEANVGYSIAQLPWPRAAQMAESDRNTCIFAATRTTQRDPLFKWIGPLLNDQYALFGRVGSPELTSLEQARNHKIGGYFGDAGAAILVEQGFKVEQIADNSLNLKRLAAHRIDYWVNSLLSGQYAVSQSDAPKSAVPLLVFKDFSLYLACNKLMPDSLVDQLNAIIQRMSGNGTMAAVTAKYIAH